MINMEAAKNTAKIVGKFTAKITAILGSLGLVGYALISVFGFFAIPISFIIGVILAVVKSVYDSEKQKIEYNKRYTR